MTTKKLKARWTYESMHDLNQEYSIPTKWELLVFKWHSKIPTSCMCKEVHPIWKYVKTVFEFIFHKPDAAAILDHEVISKMSASIAEEIDKDIIAKVLESGENDESL